MECLISEEMEKAAIKPKPETTEPIECIKNSMAKESSLSWGVALFRRDCMGRFCFS
jgi:hypothetical protein